MAQTIKLSVVIIAFNEEHNIKRCLNSIKDIADEIVIVDSYSSDNTKKIAGTFPVIWIEHAFKGHIEQKNYALRQTKYDYVLSLDADECLSEQLIAEIIKIKRNCMHDGYVFNRLTNYCGKWIYHCGWYPDRKLRLWNRHKGKWGGNNPHDKVIMKKNTSIRKINQDLLHYSYNTISDHLRQVDYFTSIAAKVDYQQGRRISLSFILFGPFIKFIRSYFLQLGFLDGYYGFVVCAISAHASFYKYLKIRQLQKKYA